jgi:signal transduction histidine kinase
VESLLSLARVPRRPTRSDLLIAGVLGVWAVLEALFVEGPGSHAARIGIALLVTVPLAFRRQVPLGLMTLVGAVIVFLSIVANEPEKGTFPFPSLLVASFSVGLYARALPAAIAGLVIGLGTPIVFFNSSIYESSGPAATNLAILTFFIGGAWLIGLLLHRRAEQARRAVAESGELARSAVSEERARIARELHDVIAHSVSAIAVQAGAAEQQIEGNPAKAREHLDAVRRSAREAMNEMRRLLGVLREDEASYIPQPGIARLPDLLDEVRGGGLEVELAEEGERPQLSPGLDLTVYRLVQEALTNARKHAGGDGARVLLRYGSRDLELDVSNRLNGPAAAEEGGGHGLVGMQERVRLFNGSFDAGPENGRFRVHVRLPLEEPGA